MTILESVQSMCDSMGEGATIIIPSAVFKLVEEEINNLPLVYAKTKTLDENQLCFKYNNCIIKFVDVANIKIDD